MSAATRPVMFDAAVYPHLYQLVAQHADRGTLHSFLRVSSWSRDLTLPILYHTVIDPLSPRPPGYDSVAEGLIANHPLPSQSTRHTLLADDRRFAEFVDDRQVEYLVSFRRSPHLALCKNIIIRDPQLWSDATQKLHNHPKPTPRGADTVTMIRVIPRLPIREELSRRSVERGQAGEGEGDEAVDGDDGSDDGSSDSDASLAEGNPAGWDDYRHIIKVAKLFPSQRLILYVPEAAGVDIHAFTNAVADYFEPPPSTRELTLIFGSGNHIGDIGEALPKRRCHWDNVEMVLIPNSDGKFTYTHTPPKKYRPPPPEGASPEETKAMKEVLPWLTIPARAYNFPTELQYWGLASLPYAGEDERALAFAMGGYGGFMQGYLEGWEEAQDEEEGTVSTKRKGTSEVDIVWEEEYWDCDMAWVKEVWDMA